MDTRTAADDDQYIDQALACLMEGIRNRAMGCSTQKVLSERERVLKELNLLKILGRRIEDHIADTTGHLNALAPIHRLPNELLTDIFHLTLLPNHHNPAVYSQRPIRICLVSKHWMGILNETPSLWAQIHSSYPNAPNILRSKGYPLRVYYDDNDFIDRGVDEEAFPNLVIREAYRWRSAEFILYYDTPSYDLLDRFVSLSAPLLETLKVRLNYGLESRASFDIFSEGADRLRHVELYDFPIRCELQILSGLETLKISNRGNLGPSVSELIGILHRCPSLRVLELRYQGWSEMYTSSAPPSDVEEVYLPALISFTLDLNHAEAFGQILSSIHVPACRNFQLQCHKPIHNILSTGASRLTLAFLSIIQTVPHISLWVRGCLLRLFNDNVSGIDISLAHYSPWENLAWLCDAGAVTLPPIHADITCTDTPFLQVADLLHNLPSITTMILTGNSDQYIAHLSHPTLRNGLREWVLPNLMDLRLDACLDNNLQLLADLSDQRQEGADIDRGDGEQLGFPRKLEWIYIPEEGDDRKSWTGPFYTALRKLKGDDWNRNMID
ncbi:hypothetical protein FRB94_003520 [Tulasnella sp. JGI-2019a]|nr:hypothetical protein FRB93_010421 [Tulasnella sp. JGI-2019a]KAG9002897.1 hypothetical protein FRB94_003520 [Tulasnella sp. JGI-2019a]